jgi:hypothetical protein
MEQQLVLIAADRLVKAEASFVLCLEDTRWFKYDRDYLCVNKSQFVPVIFEPPCTSGSKV